MQAVGKMLRKSIFLLIILLTLQGAFSSDKLPEDPIEDEQPPAKPKKSVILDKYNFEEETENDIVFVKFCSPSSAQCKKLEPIWEELATAYFEVKVVKIAEVNCRAPDDLNKKLCKKHGVTKYPTLFIYVDGHRKKEKYEGQRKFDELARYINKQLKLRRDGLPGCDKEFDKLANDFSKQSEEEQNEAIREIEHVIEDKGRDLDKGKLGSGDQEENEEIKKKRKEYKEERVKTAGKYLRIMHKIQSQGSKFVSEEIIRLENLLHDAPSKKITQSKSDDLQKNLNILKSFQIGRKKYNLKKDEF